MLVEMCRRSLKERAEATKASGCSLYSESCWFVVPGSPLQPNEFSSDADYTVSPVTHSMLQKKGIADTEIRFLQVGFGARRA